MNNPKRDVVILGGGSHAKMLGAILLRRGIAVKGYISKLKPSDDMVWLGQDEVLESFARDGAVFINGIGSVKNCELRTRVYLNAKASGAEFMSIQDTSAQVHFDTAMPEAIILLTNAVAQVGCKVGANVLINTGAILEHDVEVGPHSHIAPGAVVCGGVKIGAGVHFGAGAVALQNLHIGGGAIVGAGAVVTKNVEAGTTVVGNPARAI
ncbi:MAG: NeuD/PglB/VioB family sugar acetyltransferase [Dinoroseobacter sp.]|nr:NeuD/PglB/VioB family sugar acetyltransferase [Dinoroseobacter sp.]